MIKVSAASILIAIAGVAPITLGTAKPDLQIIFGSNGIERLAYKDVTLEDLSQTPHDAFHIWHMRSTDLQGRVLTAAQYGWGENHKSRVWDPGTHTWTYRFDWGSITIAFVQIGDALNMNVIETNYADSGIIFDGATIYPFVLHFPATPKGFNSPSYAHLAFNVNDPGVTVADFGRGEVVSTVVHTSGPLYSGFVPAGEANSYFPIISSTAMDDLASFLPHQNRPIKPGETDTFTISLRFAPSGTPDSAVAADAYQNWSKELPSRMNWTDRRMIGTVYLASSPQGDPEHSGGFPHNPRRYFNESNPTHFDIRTSNGLAEFEAKVLRQASANVENLKKLNAQGAITWDIEGQQYPHATSYVCAPDAIAQVAPEMESIISEPSSPYKGMKLDDAYFKIMRDAGFRVGVCVRPQRFTLSADGTANQVYLPTSEVKDELSRKIRFAHNRWGATLFYVDSNVEANGATLDASIFQQLAASFPDSLLIPEHSTPGYYAFTAPFKTFLFQRELGTLSEIYNSYPKAFSATLVNDVDATTLARFRPLLTTAVRHGDVLMVHTDYWQENNPTVVQIYKDAHTTVNK
jgi:hypothetical protein